MPQSSPTKIDHPDSLLRQKNDEKEKRKIRERYGRKKIKERKNEEKLTSFISKNICIIFKLLTFIDRH